uniref:Uncharacterized protein n=1 Tax=Cyanistes caeruleus TaxID=156563 RepID=A0A8C0Z806_CYACU
MCTGKCSKCIGITLFPLAVCAIVSNILLYFPNGQVLQLSEITDLVWFFHGILGAGILVRDECFLKQHEKCPQVRGKKALSSAPSSRCWKNGKMKIGFSVS